MMIEKPFKILYRRTRCNTMREQCVISFRIISIYTEHRAAYTYVCDIYIITGTYERDVCMYIYIYIISSLSLPNAHKDYSKVCAALVVDASHRISLCLVFFFMCVVISYIHTYTHIHTMCLCSK